MQHHFSQLSVRSIAETKITFLTLYSVVVANRACTTSYDFLVVLFTFIRTLGTRKARRRFEEQTPLALLLLRDGEYIMNIMTSVIPVNLSAATRYPTFPVSVGSEGHMIAR